MPDTHPPRQRNSRKLLPALPLVGPDANGAMELRPLVSVAHDLKNLFWVLELQAEHLSVRSERDPALADAVRALRQIAQDGRALSSMLTHRPRGRMPDELSVADAARCVEDLARALLPAFPRGFRLGVRLDQGLATDPSGRVIPIAPSAFRRCILNLLRNAREALPALGSIEIRVERGTGPERGLMVHVSDNGIGIPAYFLPRIFDPGFTTKRAVASAGGAGAGVGLSTVRALVEDAGGEVHVASDPSDGTRFTLWFPLLRARSDNCAK
jgi:signal transduction histidine kinase